MKRKSLAAILLMLGSIVFANDWDVQEMPYEQYFYYVVKDAPEKYKNLIGSIVFAREYGLSYRNSYERSCKDGIIEFLKNEDFSIDIDPDNKIETAFLSESFMKKFFPEFFNVNIPVTEADLDFIWKMLSSKYAGFSDMKKKGFNRKELSKINKTQDLKKLLDKYVEDCHFMLRIRKFVYRQNTAYDKGSKISKDFSNIYFEKETSNAYYVRFTSCSKENSDYFTNLPAVSYLGKDKDFIILDARSNRGGNGLPREQFVKSLNKQKYKGTVIVLQDNYSFSSGELWSALGKKDLKFKRLLIGTHSGGMQNYGECELYENEKLNVDIYFGKADYKSILPSNYLGDGKGYEPDIWATTETMASVLTGLGVDVSGIIFQ